ncbi:hypothetical protein HDV57DRAFT_443174 [Trichoderma longibrachiatum]
MRHRYPGPALPSPGLLRSHLSLRAYHGGQSCAPVSLALPCLVLFSPSDSESGPRFCACPRKVLSPVHPCILAFRYLCRLASLLLSSSSIASDLPSAPQTRRISSTTSLSLIFFRSPASTPLPAPLYTPFTPFYHFFFFFFFFFFFAAAALESPSPPM